VDPKDIKCPLQWWGKHHVSYSWFFGLSIFRHCRVTKIWPNYHKDGCKSTFNLVELIQTNLGFEEELEEFEGSFQEVEIVDI